MICDGHVRGIPRDPGSVLLGGSDESVEQRVRLVRPRDQLGVRLRRDEEGMPGELDELDEPFVGAHAGQGEARLFELVPWLANAAN